MNLGFVIFLIASATLLSGEAYRILGVFPFNGKSHFVMFGALMKELAARGHQVDVIGHHPLKKRLPNYTDVVDLSGTVCSFVNNMTFEFGTTALTEDTIVMEIATRFGGDLCDLMGQPQFRKFIRNPPQDPPYDVVIVEVFGANCYLALGNHLKVPLIGVVTSPIWPWTNDVIGNPDNSAYIPHSLSSMSGKMNFWQRLKNTWTLLRMKWQFNHYSAYQNEKIKKCFGPDAPNLSDVERNISLILEHKNIRAFMTHGGLMGTQEAIYCGVPMIGVPIFGDQTQNIELYERKHIAIRLSLSELSEKNLDSVFNAILHDPSYMESSKKISSEFRDRPMTATDTAAYCFTK